MVAQSLWEWPADDWSNLRLSNERELMPGTAWMARNLKVDGSET